MRIGCPREVKSHEHRVGLTPESVRETARAQIPMNRLGTAEDCVGAYIFLCSAAMSGYITGQIIDVNGGQLMP